MLKYAPGTKRYEEYAAFVVEALKDLRHFSISDQSQDALPLCMVLNSKTEQTLFEGLSEICHRVLMKCNQSFCGCDIMSKLHAWQEICLSKKTLTLKLLSFGALETCLELALNPSHSTRVTESSNILVHNFVCFPDGISRFVSFLEKESKSSAIVATQEYIKQSPNFCQFDRMIRLVDIVTNLYNSPTALESIIKHIHNKSHRMAALFQRLLAAAAAMFTTKHHPVSRKV